MKAAKAAVHTLIILAALFLAIGLPIICTGAFGIWTGVDTFTSATTVTDKPSGNYVVLVNTDKHTDESKLEQWKTFFSGGDAGYIMEDVDCVVADNDPGALEMAKNYQSRLSENQMSLKTEDSTLLCSKADNGVFDILVFSKESAESTGITETVPKGTVVIEVKGGTVNAEEN